MQKVYLVLLIVVWACIMKRKDILAGTSEWVMTGNGPVLKIPQVNQGQTSEKKGSPRWVIQGEPKLGRIPSSISPVS